MPQLLSLEASKSPEERVFAKLSVDGHLGDHCIVKKVSMDTKKVCVADMDVVGIMRDTTFVLRNEVDLEQRAATKAQLGMRYVNKVVATDIAFDLVRKTFNTSAVVRVRPAWRCRLPDECLWSVSARVELVLACASACRSCGSCCRSGPDV